MAYSLNLIINGKKTNFKRTEAPFVVDQTRVLILQQHQIKTFGADDGPTDKALIANQDEVGKFASDFFRNQFTSEDFVNGAHFDAVDVINGIISECLGTDDDSTDSKETKK